MLQLPTPVAVDPCSASVREQPPDPSETVTVPPGQAVPLAGVTDTWTLSVVPCQMAICVVPVIAVVVSTAVLANAVPGVSSTPPNTPPATINPAARPAVRRQTAPTICAWTSLSTRRPESELGRICHTCL